MNLTLNRKWNEYATLNKWEEGATPTITWIDQLCCAKLFMYAKINFTGANIAVTTDVLRHVLFRRTGPIFDLFLNLTYKM